MFLHLTDLIQATWETVKMVIAAGIISITLGLGLGLLLFLTDPRHLRPKPHLYRGLSAAINVMRSIPFVILMIAVIPITRWIMGTAIGTNAAIVPLAIAALPFYARVAETALAQIDPGMIEAALAMGLNLKQIILKVILPESLSGLIQGAALTLINLVAYSAMAGAVGGGGLGQLAIEYGYQRFDILVMLETIVILVLLVQGIQFMANRFALKPRARNLWILIAFFGLGLALDAFLHPNNTDVLRVGIVAGPSEQVMAVAKTYAHDHEHLDLKIVVFNDYLLPNEALNSGNLDANIFQHLPFLNEQIQIRGYHLTPLAKTFLYPMGIYSKQIHHLQDLNYGAVVAIPNDPSNEARALLLFQAKGLISLKPSAGFNATVLDIVHNPLHLQFKTLDAAELPRVFEDATLVALNNDYLAAAHLIPTDALFTESKNAPYANLIVIQSGHAQDTRLQKLVNVMHSNPVVAETEKLFPNGAAIPAWREDAR